MSLNNASEKTSLNQRKTDVPVFIYTVTILSAVGGFLFGYDTGVVSGAIILLRDYFSLNFLWQEIVVSVTICAAWLFALIGGIGADRCGRKPVIIFASFLFTIGALVMGLSNKTSILVVGRVIVGAGIGLASMTVPMYIAEVSPAEIRGRLVTINQCSITLGQFIASVVDGIFSADTRNGWRYMLGLAGVPSAIQFFSFLFMPESPRWLMKKGKHIEALKVLKAIRGSHTNIDKEYNDIKNSCDEDDQKQNENSFVIIRVLKMPTLRRALIVGCSLQIIQQLAGINTVMYYSATIIQMSGVKDNRRVIWLSCATAAMNSVCSFTALFFIEKVGRRILTLVSLAGVIFSLSFLAISFQLAAANSPMILDHNHTADGDCAVFSNCASCVNNGKCGFCFVDTSHGPENGSCLLANPDRTSQSQSGSCNSSHLSDEVTWAFQWCPSSYSWMTLLGLLLYLFFFAQGMGPAPWTVNSEIYPLWARSTCYSVATSFNWLFNFAVSLTFLTLTQALTKSGTFWLYACISAAGFVFLFLMLPETKGRSLEEVEELFIQPWWKKMNFCNNNREPQKCFQEHSTTAIPAI